MKKKYSERKYWTLSEMEEVYRIWDNSTVEEVAKKFKVTTAQVQSLATTMRKNDIPLPFKHRKGYIQPLIAELKKKLKLK